LEYFDDIKLTVWGFVFGFLGVIVLAVSEALICIIGQEVYPNDFYSLRWKLFRYQAQRNWKKNRNTTSQRQCISL